MRIFLDTRDLINLLKRRQPCSSDAFREWLMAGGHTLVLSPVVVFEFAAPLVNPQAPAGVTRLLNEIESFPLEYIAAVHIIPLEIRAAMEAHAAGAEYQPINPLVARFERALPSAVPIPERLSLSEAMWKIAEVAPTALAPRDGREARLQRMLANDRAVPYAISPSDFFVVRMQRHVADYGIPAPAGGVEAAARWIYDSVERCPGVRLHYEVYHRLRRNVGDAGQLGDFADIAHVHCVPYVDAATLDARMTSYVQQATRGWARPLSDRVYPNLAAIMALGTTGGAEVM